MLVVALVAGHLDEARLRPAAQGALVPRVRVDSDRLPACGEQRRGERAGRVRHQPPPASLGHEETVEAASARLVGLPPGLEVADRPSIRLDDPGIDTLSPEARVHLL